MAAPDAEVIDLMEVADVEGEPGNGLGLGTDGTGGGMAWRMDLVDVVKNAVPDAGA